MERLPLPESGRVLDIGTGSGLQLQTIYKARPDLELHGLDLSRLAIKVARANLVGLDIKMKQGDIEQAPYLGNFFDLATGHASMSFWVRPDAGFNEVFRILKPGGTAVFFEPHKDVDVDKALAAIRDRMADENLVRRFLAVTLNRLALRRGERFGMHLYSMDEIGQVIARSNFGASYDVEETALMDVPIYMQITLRKPNH